MCPHGDACARNFAYPISTWGGLMEVVMSNPYDVVPYPTGAEARLHIEHLQVCATLNGFSPAAVETARVIEIGCGNGFNLGPMAAQFPNASFVGLDYAASAIEKGRAAMEGL